MKLFREGEKSKAVCRGCAKVVTTTFQVRDVPFSDDKETLAKDILVGVCDTCSTVVSIPAQSTPSIQKARKEKPASIEARLPVIYMDMLDYAVHVVDAQASPEFRNVILTYFVHRAAHRSKAASALMSSHVKATEEFPDARGDTRKRLSIKVAPRVNENFKSLLFETKLNTTEIIKSVVYEIRDDVIESPKEDLLNVLRALSVIAI